MQKETVTFDKLPEAVGYLTEQVIELKKMVAELQPQPSDKHVLVEIEDAISMRTNFLLGLRTGVERVQNRLTRRCWQICKAVSVISPNHP